MSIIVDLFAGGGGASTGIRNALGRDPHIAVNHDRDAIAMHQANHPDSQHFLCDIREVDPRAACAGRDVELLWASPDCKHFSRAKGGRPVSDSVRTLPWVIPRWLDAVRPRVFMMENVPEFRTWGPLVDSRPDKTRKGETFKRWLGRLEKLKYEVEFRELSAHHYNTPTTRKRLFLVGRCDREPIRWPTPTNGPGLAPYRTAAECIDWRIPCPSIFERSEPLEEATLRRIARGIQKFVLGGDPFIVPVTHQGDVRVDDINDPFRTITGANRGEIGVWAPSLVQVGWGERYGQAPRCMDANAPLGTMPAGGIKHAVAVAHLMQAYGGNYKGAGSSCQMALPTITTRDHNHLVTTQLTILRNHADGASVRGPIPTACAGGMHIAETRAFLARYNGTSIGQHPSLPLTTVDTRDRFAVVTIGTVDYVIVDIGFRMLTPRELFRAQGFPENYQIDRGVDGRKFTKTAQVRMVGNSVAPPVAEALVRANVDARAVSRIAA